MFKFNSTNIFAGYIKQLLSSFNLPKYRVYTKEQEQYHNEYAQKHNELTKKLEEITAEINDLEEQAGDEPEKIAGYAEIHEKLTAEKAALEAAIEKLTPEKDVIISMYRQKNITYDDRNKVNIIESYPKHMRYIPYIRNNELQIYAPTIETEVKTAVVDGIESTEITSSIKYSDHDWKAYHGSFDAGHEALHGKDERFISRGYVYGLKIKNGTKNLKIDNNTYDSYTHEYLGDYLRFHRDYYNINLMPLYNCFSNKVCPNLNVKFQVSDKYAAEFKTADKNYKIYMLPIKFFQKYTIAIDCNNAVEMCCGLYGHYEYKSAYNALMQSTYFCFNNLHFNTPVLIDPTSKMLPYLKPEHELELAQHEDDLKLFIKLPANNKSSITILEGDYTDYSNPIWGGKFEYPGLLQNNTKTNDPNLEIKAEVITAKTGFNELSTDDTANALILQQIVDRDKRQLFSTVAYTDDSEQVLSWKTRFIYNGEPGLQDYTAESGLYSQNKTVINFENKDVYSDKLITPLQLLKVNSGTSYPFAERLIEYLVGNAITPLDSIGDDIKRTKTAVIKRLGYPSGITSDELWDDALKVHLYNYATTSSKMKNISHDTLGYVDKDVENYYAYVNKVIKYKNGHELPEKDWEREIKTISSTNIYSDREWED